MTTKLKKAENGNSVSFRVKFVVHWGAALVLGRLSWSCWVARLKKKKGENQFLPKAVCKAKH